MNSILKVSGEGQKNARAAILLEGQTTQKTLDMSEGFYETHTRITLELVNEDASGKSSSAATINGGTKAKRINISTRLPFTAADKLTQLTQVAQATQEGGEREIFIITESTADAMDIREVIFDDRIEVSKADKLQAWNLSFSLKEYKSVPELAEARGEQGEFSASGRSGVGVGGEEEEAEIGPSGWLFEALKKVDNYLGGNPESENK